MDTKENPNTDQALMFFNSVRGRYIISQALYYAIKTLEKVPSPHTEVSNIEDMQFLLDNLFPMFKSLQELEGK